MIHQDEIQNEFGLRAIKAIISMAEIMKLQSYGLKENLLTYIVDDFTMNGIPIKSQEILKDFLGKGAMNLENESENGDSEKGLLNETDAAFF